MFTKKILLIGLSLVSFNISTQAVVNCATDCIKETACRFSFKINECAKNCSNFKADICSAKASVPATTSAPTSSVTSDTMVNPTTAVTSKPVSIDQGSLQPTPSNSRPRAQRFDKPPLPAPTGRALPTPPKATPPASIPGDLAANSSLFKDQIEMLTEVNRVAGECDRMAYDLAKKGAIDPQAYESYVKNQDNSGEAKEVFPKSLKSIFPNNPKYCSETIDPKKMDHQSFVSYLKNQVTTTKTMQADILRKILGWKDTSKIENYKVSVSSDLRALSSFCSAPIKMLDSAIQSRANTPQKKPGILRQLKNQMLKKGEKINFN